MKALFFMPHAGAARNFKSTLCGLAERGHEVHMAFDRMTKKNLPGHSDLANDLADQYPGITMGVHPRIPKTDWFLVSGRLRLSLDYMRFSGREFDGAPKLRRRAEKWVPPRADRLYSSASRPVQTMLRSVFRSAERAVPADETALAYIKEQSPDLVLFTPLLEPGSMQPEFLRAANRLGVPTCLCVHSWDNLTNKGLIHEAPDAVVVWNEMQVEEAVNLHRVPEKRAVATGATAYDHWFSWETSRRREEFAAVVGLDPDRPFVLYLGSSGFIAPDEAGFIVEWVEELRRQGLGDVQVLARPHPSNPLVGGKPSHAELARLENVKLYPPAGANPTNETTRKDYFDSLYYCSAATGVNTSAFLEAAILGRPVLTVLAPRYEETQTGMLHFHHLLTAGGGLLHVGHTYEEHAEQLREALAGPHPESRVDERSRGFTEAFIRPYGIDEPATPRMLATLEQVAEESTESPRVTLTGALLARSARVTVRRARRRARSEKGKRKGRLTLKPKASKQERAASKAEARAVKEAHHRAKAEARAAKEAHDKVKAEARAAKAAKERQRESDRKAKAEAKARKPAKSPKDDDGGDVAREVVQVPPQGPGEDPEES